MKIERPYIIAEIGLNHDGDISQALEMIREAKNAHLDAVKFQTIHTKELVSPYIFNEKGKKIGENQFFQALEKLEITEKDHETIQNLCQQLEIDFISSAFDTESLKIVGKYCDAIKIASSELTNQDLLRACGAYDKPVFISMGMGTLEELLEAINTLKKAGIKEIYPLYCVSLYPLPYKECNLRVITSIIEKTGLITGFSDHTIDETLSLGAIALGAKIIEKHVTLKREERLFDHGFSMEFQEMAALKEHCHHLFDALGDGIQKVGVKEAEVKKGSRRSFFALCNINPGEELKSGVNIHAVRPVVGISLEEKEFIEGKKATRVIQKGFPIFKNDIE